MTGARVVGGILALAALVAMTGSARAGSTYAEANDAFTSADYREAIAGYEALVSAGVVHEDLFYNLGNACFRAGRLGPAIYAYERALRIEPGFDDARYNLSLAREAVANVVEDRLVSAEGDPLAVRVIEWLSIATATWLFVIANLAVFGLLIARRFVAPGVRRKALSIAAAICGVWLAISATLLIGRAVYLDRVTVGIVLPDRLVMREGADDSAAERVQVHAGIRVRIIDRDPEWLKVRLANGTEGWVPRDAVGLL